MENTKKTAYEQLMPFVYVFMMVMALIAFCHGYSNGTKTLETLGTKDGDKLGGGIAAAGLIVFAVMLPMWLTLKLCVEAWLGKGNGAFILATPIVIFYIYVSFVALTWGWTYSNEQREAIQESYESAQYHIKANDPRTPEGKEVLEFRKKLDDEFKDKYNTVVPTEREVSDRIQDEERSVMRQREEAERQKVDPNWHSDLRR
jgi:hypothetical protein